MRQVTTKKDLKELARVFGILKNKNRLAIINYLKRKKRGSVGVIADNIKISFKATSKHLLFLVDKEILRRRYDGPFVIYKIRDDLPETTRLIIRYLV